MNRYGAHETNGLTDHGGDPAEYHARVSYDDLMSLSEVQARGGRISRLRLLTEVWPGLGRMADISYCHATLPDGSTVPVRITGDLMGVPLRRFKGALIEWAKAEGVYAVGIGLLDEGNWSVMYG